MAGWRGSRGVGVHRWKRSVPEREFPTPDCARLRPRRLRPPQQRNPHLRRRRPVSPPPPPPPRPPARPQSASARARQPARLRPKRLAPRPEPASASLGVYRAPGIHLGGRLGALCPDTRDDGPADIRSDIPVYIELTYGHLWSHGRVLHPLKQNTLGLSWTKPKVSSTRAPPAVERASSKRPPSRQPAEP